MGYCTDNILTRLDQDDPVKYNLIFKLAQLEFGESFTSTNVVQLVDGYAYDDAEAYEFITEFTQRRFFQNDKHGPDVFRWIPQIQLQIQKNKNYVEPIKEDEEEKIVTEYEEEQKSESNRRYDATYRKKLYDWMNLPKGQKLARGEDPKSPKTFDFAVIMEKIKEERELSYKQLASAYYLLFDVKEGINRKVFPEKQAIFDKDLTEILIDLSLNSKKHSGTKSSLSSSGVGLVETEEGELVRRTSGRFWNYCSQITQQLFKFLKKRNEADFLIPILTKIIEKINSLYYHSIINKEESLEFKIFCLSELTSDIIVENNNLKNMLYMQLVTSICEELSPQPKKLREDLVITLEEKRMYEMVYRFFIKDVPVTLPGIDILEGYIFWISLKLAANESPGSSQYERYMDSSDSLLDYGYELVKGFMTKSIVRDYVKKLGLARRKLVWNIKTLYEQKERRFGILNKIIYANLNDLKKLHLIRKHLYQSKLFISRSFEHDLREGIITIKLLIVFKIYLF